MGLLSPIIKFLVQLLAALLPGIIKAVQESKVSTAENARPQPGLKGELERQVLAKWGSAMVLLFALAFFCVGCSPGIRAIYVDDGEPVRLAQDVACDVWVMGADGKPVLAHGFTLKNGWYALHLKKPEAPAAPPAAQPAK